MSSRPGELSQIAVPEVAAEHLPARHGLGPVVLERPALANPFFHNELQGSIRDSAVVADHEPHAQQPPTANRHMLLVVDVLPHAVAAVDLTADLPRRVRERVDVHVGIPRAHLLE